MKSPLNDSSAAEYVGVATQTLRNWRHQGRGPVYHKLSPGPRGRVVYFQEDLDAYLAKCRIKPENPA